MPAYARTDIHIAYSVVTKYLFAITHQMWRSQVLPRYPHSFAGAYGIENLEGASFLTDYMSSQTLSLD